MTQFPGCFLYIGATDQPSTLPTAVASSASASIDDNDAEIQKSVLRSIKRVGERTPTSFDLG